MNRWTAAIGALLLTTVMLGSSVAGATGVESAHHVSGTLAIVSADTPATPPGSPEAASPPSASAITANQPAPDVDTRSALLETADGIIPLDLASVPASAQTGATVSAVVGDDGVGQVQAVSEAPAPAAIVTGTHKVLLITVTWIGAAPQPLPNDPATTMDDIKTWYASASNGQLTLAGKLVTDPPTVGPTITLNSAQDYCNTTFSAVANVDGLSKTAGYDPSDYDNVMYRMPPAPSCPWQGIAYVGGNRLIINGASGANDGTDAGKALARARNKLVVVHELGHNLGLEHANHLDCVNASYTAWSSIESVDSGLCQTHDYADQYSAMGNYAAGEFTGSQLQQLGWLSGGNVTNLTGIDSSTCLQPLAGASSSTKLATFEVSGIGTIYLENRQLVGVDTILSGSQSLGVQARTVRRNSPDPGFGVGAQSHLLANRPERYGTSGYYYDTISSIPPADPWAPLGGQVQVTTSAPVGGCIPVTVHNELAPVPPAAPTAVVASAANAAAIVSWTAPASPAGNPITSYTATASPGGQACTSTTTSCTVAGLANGTTYTFTVTATNGNGTGPASTPSAGVTPPGKFTAVTPARLLDTRPGLPTIDGVSAGAGAVGTGAIRNLRVLGRGGVPNTGVAAVVLNITVTSPSYGGFVTAWPHGTARPNASTINFVGGQTTANLAIVKVGADGTIDLYNAFGTTDVIADVQGWFPTNVAITPLSPARLLDTRPGYATVDGQAAGSGAIGEGQTRSLPVLGRGGVPASGVSAVALNITVTAPSWSSFVTAFPHGTAQPVASNINFTTGQTVAILVIAKVGTDGMVDLYNRFGTVDLVADVQGWFPTGAEMTSLTPARVLDTRPGYGTVDGLAAGQGPVTAAANRNLQVLGRGGVPASGVGAVALNVTVTGPNLPSGVGSFLTVYPHGSSRPNASNLNFTGGQTIANLVIVKVGADGTIDLYNQYGNVQVVADVQGWFPS